MENNILSQKQHEEANFFAVRLYRVLKKYNIEISQLADSCGLPANTIRRWVTGERTPTKEKLIQLSKSEFLMRENLSADDLNRLAHNLLNKKNFSSAEEVLSSIKASDLTAEEQEELIIQIFQGLPDQVLVDLINRANLILGDRLTKHRNME